MKILQLLWVVLFFSASVFAQSNKYQTAFFKVEEYVQSDKKDTDALLDAAAAINETVLNESAAEKPKTWYYYGLIHHLIYENEALKNDSSLLKAARGYRMALSTEDKKFGDAKLAKDNLYNVGAHLQNQGSVLYNAGGYEKAYDYFMKVIEIKNFLDSIGYEKKLDDQYNKFYAAVSMYHLGKEEESKAILQELMDKQYDNAAVYQILAGFYSKEENYAKAHEILRKGLERYPKNVGLIIDEINLYIAQKNSEEAIPLMEQAVRLDSQNVQLLFAIGDAYGENGNKVKAEEYYRKAIQIDPKFYNAYNNLGALFYNEGIEVHKELSDNMKLSDKEYKALTEKRNELYKKSLPYFEKAHELNPDNVQVLRALKEVYARLELYDKSKEMKAKLEKLGAK